MKIARPGSLLRQLATVPDRRSRKGRRHPLAAILALGVAAMLAGARSLYAICQWGRLQPPEVVQALGFTRPRTPAVSTLHLVFSHLDVEAFETALRGWAREEGGEGKGDIAIDGKGLRGIHGEELPGVRLVAAYCDEAGQVLAQAGVRTEQKEAELGVAPRLLAQLDLRDRLVTGDALFAQRKLCQQVLDGGGDYLWVVKKNQPTLYEDIDLLFREPPPGERFGVAAQTGKHGDRVEVRTVWTSTALDGYLDWPGARQVCKVQREVLRKGKQTVEVRCGLTSLGVEAGDPTRLLEALRGHWTIENRLHDVRDVTMGEDGSQVRTGSAPQVLAALRNSVLGVLRHAGATNIAAALREVGWTQGSPLRLLGLPAP